MKAYKLEVVVLDHDGMSVEEVISVIENQRYPNRCISPSVVTSIEADIGEWTDDHPLNRRDTFDATIEEVFGDTRRIHTKS
jgi:hypothetical protein